MARLITEVDASLLLTAFGWSILLKPYCLLHLDVVYTRPSTGRPSQTAGKASSSREFVESRSSEVRMPLLNFAFPFVNKTSFHIIKSEVYTRITLIRTQNWLLSVRRLLSRDSGQWLNSAMAQDPLGNPESIPLWNLIGAKEKYRAARMLR